MADLGKKYKPIARELGLTNRECKRHLREMFKITMSYLCRDKGIRRHGFRHKDAMKLMREEYLARPSLSYVETVAECLRMYLRREAPYERAFPDGFYATTEWRRLRREVLEHYGEVCMKCGNTREICVDHVLPRRKYPKLELDFSNMQVLCNTCNLVKGQGTTDYREAPRKHLEKPTVFDLSKWPPWCKLMHQPTG